MTAPGLQRLEEELRQLKAHERRKHTTEENFQHFLSYSNLRVLIPAYLHELRWAFFAGADKPPPERT